MAPNPQTPPTPSTADNPVPTRPLMTAAVLRVLRRELTNTLRPELTSGYATYVATVMAQMLDYMADWAAETGDPDTDRARAAPLAPAPPTPPRTLPAFDDLAGLDEALADAIAQAAASDLPDRLETLAAAAAAADDALYTAQTDRHAQTSRATDALLARIDPELTADRFDRYAAARLDLHDPVAAIHKIPGGHSKDTFLVTLASGADIIVRRDFPFGPVDTSAADEYDLLRHLHRHGMKVPRPIAAERDPQWLGQPCLLVEKVPGADAHEAGMRDRAVGRSVSFELAAILARLHSLDPAASGIGGAGADPHQAVRGYLAGWRRWWDQNRIHASSLNEAAFAWLERNVPADIARVVIVHGDARPGNMLLAGGAVTSLLDWEFAHVGDPAEDLQYAKGFIEPFVAWDEFLAAYLAAGGVPVSDAGNRFYDVFRSLRNVICTDAAWGGFVRGRYPAFKLAAQGVVYKRMLAQALAKSMQSVSWT